MIVNLLEAVSELHSMGLIHRDLKPANVLVFDDLSIKLCDFGLSRSLKNLTKTSNDIIQAHSHFSFVTPPQKKQ